MCGRAGVSIGPTNHPSAQPLARANTRSHFTTGFLQQKMALAADTVTVRVQVA